MNKYLLSLYYILLLIIVTSWASIDSAPSTILRIGFLAAVVLPGFIKKNFLLPLSIAFFWILTSNGYAYSYMPTSSYLYVLIMLTALLTLGKNKYRLTIKEFKIWCCFFIWVTIVNFTLDFSIENISYSICFILLTFYFFKDNDTKLIDMMSIMFMVLTIVISYYAITMKDNILLAKYLVQDRIQWVDPNYMGMQVGMGAVVGLINCLKFQKLDIVQKVLSPISLAMAFPAILLTASRGASLSILVAIFIMMLSAKVKMKFKIFVVILLLLLMYYLFVNGSFDVLMSRFEDDNGTGSNRSEIWMAKLSEFMNNPLYWLTGCGYSNGLLLGFNKPYGFHNDFLAVLCMYGIIGLTLFVYLIILPILKVNKTNAIKYEVYTCGFYSILASLTLEPIESGVIAFYIFMVYTALKAKYSNYEKA